MQHAHTLYMGFNNLVSVQIKFKLFTIRNFVHTIIFNANALYPWKLNYSTKMWHRKFMDAIHMVQNVY
jgi:hypothetical protein